MCGVPGVATLVSPHRKSALLLMTNPQISLRQAKSELRSERQYRKTKETDMYCLHLPTMSHLVRVYPMTTILGCAALVAHDLTLLLPNSPTPPLSAIMWVRCERHAGTFWRRSTRGSAGTARSSAAKCPTWRMCGSASAATSWRRCARGEGGGRGVRGGWEGAGRVKGEGKGTRCYEQASRVEGSGAGGLERRGTKG